KPVGERLDHDRRIVVVGVLEPPRDFVVADVRGDDEGAYVVPYAARSRGDEIGERQVGPPVAARELLAKRKQRGDRPDAGFIGVELDVVADPRRRPEADDRLRREPSLVDDA